MTITSFLSNILLLCFINCYSLVLTAQQPVITNPKVEKIWSGFSFVEGPVWIDTLGLLFSDIPANKVYRFNLDSTINTYLTPSGRSNGLALDKSGSLVMAQHLERQVARLEANGTITPLATHFEGKRLNSPNDLAVKSDGSIFFTDPPYGLNDQGGVSELGYNGIYRLSTSGEVQLLDNSLSRPNGIAFSPDESKLYVDDSETRRIYVWDVVNDTAITNKRQFAFMQPSGYADGMKVDSLGYLYVAGPIGIWIFSPDGVAVDTIPIPEQTTNCGWGGPYHDILYVTSGSSIYRISKNQQLTPPTFQVKIAGDEKESLFSYPNPFHNNLMVECFLPNSGNNKIMIYNITGELMAILLDQFSSAGQYRFSWDASGEPPGIYFIVLTDSDKNTMVRNVLKN
jgi:gluconolactonase